ncbi:MAG TPA: DUF1059 domain-containing protein [Frankiaceae bacterium]|nr:DUF1059 domain-containing protein [Frankiaceae bacterium]
MRKIADCRALPSENNCSLTMTGEEDEVVRAAVDHAVSVHGHVDSPEFREQIRSFLTDETGRYGTVMIGKMRSGGDEMRAALQQWVRDRNVPGFLREDLLAAEDGTIVAGVTFASREDYQRLGDDPAQSEWWSTVLAPMLDGEPLWFDGPWLEPIERLAPGSSAQLPAQSRPSSAETRSGQQV